MGLTIDECCKKCIQTKHCQAYSFKFGIQTECRLKYAIGTGFHPDLKSVSGVVQKGQPTTPETGVIEINDDDIFEQSLATYPDVPITTTFKTVVSQTTTKKLNIRPTTTTIGYEQSLENCKREANVKLITKSTLDLLSIVSVDSDSCCYMCGLINECVGFNYIKEIPKCLLISRNEGKYRVHDTKFDYYSRTR